MADERRRKYTEDLLSREGIPREISKAVIASLMEINA
jgi:hypothetical protein